MNSALLIAALATAGPAPPEAPTTPLLRPEEAIALAVADASQLASLGADVSNVRYVWDHDGATASRVVLFAAAVSMNQAGRVPVQSVGFDGRLVRLDLARFAPKAADRVRLLAAWEKFGPLDSSTYIKVPTTVREQIPTAPYVQNGKRYTARWETRTTIATAFAPHVQSEQSLLLATALGTSVPLVRADVFVAKSLSTLNNGIYYDLRGFAPVANQVDRDAIFARYGVDLSDSVRLQAVARAVKTISGVTFKPRAILTFQGRGGLDNQGLVSLTLDFREPTAANRDPIRNPLTLESDAGEAFIERRDGLLEYLLFNGDGELQDVAPPDIAIDPGDVHSAQVQPAISCIRCHVVRGPGEGRSFAGWLPVGREIPDSVKSGLDVFGDVSRNDQNAAVDEIAGAYAADMEKRFRRARDDFSASVLAATGGWEPRKTAEAVERVYSDYEFRPVDAEIACRELGVRVKAEEAAVTLRELLPPLPPDAAGIAPEDPYAGLIKQGTPLTRRSWEQILPDAMLRSAFNVERVRNARSK